MHGKTLMAILAALVAAPALAAPPAAGPQDVRVVNSAAEAVPVTVTNPTTSVTVGNTSASPVPVAVAAKTTDRLWFQPDYVTVPAGSITWFAQYLDLTNYGHMTVVLYCPEQTNIFMTVVQNGMYLAYLDQFLCNGTVVKYYDVAVQSVAFGANQEGLATDGRVNGVIYARP